MLVKEKNRLQQQKTPTATAKWYNDSMSSLFPLKKIQKIKKPNINMGYGDIYSVHVYVCSQKAFKSAPVSQFIRK